MTLKARLTGAAALLAATLLLGACGAATVEVTGRAKATTPGPETTVADDGPGDTAPSTVPAATTAPPPAPTGAPTTSPAPTERSDEAFCNAAGKVLDTGVQSMPDLDLANPDLDAAKQQLIESMRTIERVVTAMDRAAPPAIAADMHTVAAATTAAVASIDDAKSGEDLFNSMSDLTTTEVASATEGVTRYTLEHCGFSLEGTATD
ncbi:MAG TPA: hypothetical protein VFN21_08995 [Acidimicrobiales bacterium]|nr:hypothetical protein [Acidimicrobiales bacterium]